MADKMLIVAGGTPFDTRPFGGLKYDGSTFSLNKPKIFNNARKLNNAGGNYRRVWRCGYPSWDGMGKILDWKDPQYFPLMREYLSIIHQPIQGAGATQLPPGARIWFELFDGFADEAYLSNPSEARKMIQAMFANLGDIPYLDFSTGNELNSKDWCDFVEFVIFPEFLEVEAGKVQAILTSQNCFCLGKHILRRIGG